MGVLVVYADLWENKAADPGWSSSEPYGPRWPNVRASWLAWRVPPGWKR